jgi:hypothetical protein
MDKPQDHRGQKSSRTQRQQVPHPPETPVNKIDKVAIYQPQENESRQPSVLRRRRLSHSDELLLDYADNLAIDKPKRSKRLGCSGLQALYSDGLPFSFSFEKSVRMPISRSQENDLNGRNQQGSELAASRTDFSEDDSPITSSVPTEVEDDEIVNLSSPVSNPLSSSVKRDSSRRLSQVAIQALQLVSSRPVSLQPQIPINNESQGSVELGNSQLLLRGAMKASISESQFSEQNKAQKKSRTMKRQGTKIEEEDWASQHLKRATYERAPTSSESLKIYRENC